MEEAQKLKDQAEKLKAEAEKAKIKAEQAKEEAEQHGYDVGVAKTEDTLRAEVPAVCWVYCTQTWEEALNWARVEASSEFRKSENIYFPPAIRTSDLASTQGEATSIVAGSAKEVQPQDPFPPNQQE